jgi:hypothetical protein
MSLLGAVFIPQPWLALIPAAVFLLLYRLAHRKLAAAAALIWLLYAIYEYAMNRRWLCSGECNVRIDLLLLYPVLLLMSAAAVVSAVLRRRPPGDSRA